MNKTKKITIAALLTVITILIVIKGKDFINTKPQDVGPEAKPDLVITEAKLTGPTVIAGNLMRTITYTVKNQGGATANLKRVDVQGYLTQDDVYVPANMVAGCGADITTLSRYYELAAGQSISGTFNCQDKGQFIAGWHYVLFVNLSKTLQESNFDNNFLLAQ